jgi:hypothetical protein
LLHSGAMTIRKVCLYCHAIKSLKNMNLDLPIFDLLDLKRSFYYFFVFNLIIMTVGIFFRGALGILVNYGIIPKNTTWIIFILLIIPSYIYSNWSKKEIKKIIAITDFREQFEKYEQFFKNRLLWNTLSVGISAAFLLIINKNSFFYILIIQAVLSLLFYPGKRVISRELSNSDIVFT